MRPVRCEVPGYCSASIDAKQLDEWLVELDAVLGVGMQVMENSLCNWQKIRRRSCISGDEWSSRWSLSGSRQHSLDVGPCVASLERIELVETD